MDTEPNDRSLIAVAASWVSRIIAVSVLMVLPGLAGWWLDGWLGTQVLFMLLGFGLGLTVAIWYLVQMTGVQTTGGPAAKDRRPKDRRQASVVRHEHDATEKTSNDREGE